MSVQIVLFRDDLRLADHPALHAAARTGPVLCAYIHDLNGPHPDGAALAWWRHQALARLDRDLQALGGSLVICKGDLLSELTQLIVETDATGVHWSRRYTPGGIAADTELKAHLQRRGIPAQSHAGRYLVEPWQVATKSGTPFKVFTPFWRAATAMDLARPVLPVPKIDFAGAPKRLPVDALNLCPASPDWGAKMLPYWRKSAPETLVDFLQEGAAGYAVGRDRADQSHVSRLSPYLTLGMMSPAQVWQTVSKAEQAGRIGVTDATKFRAELGWREFSAYLLYHFPHILGEEFQPKFASFPWRDDPDLLRAWQRGRTGYPLVDAGMRELWETGYMHNRVRMVVASFLVKHLLIDWRHGRDWFWDTLVDADLASNTASWQWVAGCGADAAPYFRIFNPISQADKADPNAEYIARWCPELAHLPIKERLEPWTCGGLLDDLDYPAPIVHHAAARAAALQALQSVK